VAYQDGSQPTSAWWRSDLVYDGRGRLRRALAYTWVVGSTNSYWSLSGETHYHYDGNLVIQERVSVTGYSPQVGYTHGVDLGGTLEGAGGIGGLLERSSGSGLTTHYFYHADGNGNITALADNTQTVVGNYRYDPYGNTLYANPVGPGAANTFRFSSKMALHGMYYYGYRWYDPNLQRWLNRDPLGSGRISARYTGLLENAVGPIELYGGANLYQFVYNDALNKMDPFGLDVWVIRSCGWPGHEWVVGSNPDGTYWDSNFHPDTKSGYGLNCKGKTDFNPKSGFDPNNLDPCLSIIEHVQTSPSVDAKVKDEANRRADKPKQPRYDACGNNCRDYAEGMANYARGAQARDNLPK